MFVDVATQVGLSIGTATGNIDSFEKCEQFSQPENSFYSSSPGTSQKAQSVRMAKSRSSPAIENFDSAVTSDSCLRSPRLDFSSSPFCKIHKWTVTSETFHGEGSHDSLHCNYYHSLYFSSFEMYLRSVNRHIKGFRQESSRVRMEYHKI